MKTELIRFLAATAICTLVSPAASAQTVNSDAQQLAEFQNKVKQYAALRDKAAKGAARAAKTDDPAKIEAAQMALGAKIRLARADVKAGDIFTPAVRPIFRRLLTPVLKGPDGKDIKAAIRDDNPGPLPLKVNETYPKAKPLSTVPADILKSLPPLPEDMEYRFAGKHLLLYDPRANLIVDFIPNAMP